MSQTKECARLNSTSNLNLLTVRYSFTSEIYFFIFRVFICGGIGLQIMVHITNYDNKYKKNMIL